MHAYQFLCPRCGKAFEEGTTLTVCPDCRVLLRSTAAPPAGSSTSASDLGNLASPIDLAALMRELLAGDPREEEVDVGLRRILQDEQPQAAEGLFRVISELLGAQQRMRGISRLEAVAQLASARSELRMSPEGKPQITSFQVRVQGLEQLAPEQREQVLEELEEAVRTGKPLPTNFRMTLKSREKGRPSFVLALAALAVGLLAICYLLGRG
ncbi:MAG TPA: hypothetical protein VG013_16155 [Gemmataceae bacterium]|jgi:hypothetical protein|nr:hypothetical protein [Gemmataceae bacterium]